MLKNGPCIAQRGLDSTAWDTDSVGLFWIKLYHRPVFSAPSPSPWDMQNFPTFQLPHGKSRQYQEMLSVGSKAW